MVDASLVIRDYLLSKPEIVAVVADRVYAERSAPPPGYREEDGPCIVFKVRGGSISYEDALLLPSVQIACYAPSAYDARIVWNVVFSVLHGATTARILHAEAADLGESLVEPETGWNFVVGYFSMMIRN